MAMPLPYHMRRALLSTLVAAREAGSGRAGSSSGGGSYRGQPGAGSGLVDIGRGFRFSSRGAGDFRRAIAAAQAEGVDLYGINNTYRSVQQQQGLWNNALKKYGSAQAARKWVAPPGKSKHNQGLAIDFSNPKAMDWMKRRGMEFGFQNYAPERWHYSYTR